MLIMALGSVDGFIPVRYREIYASPTANFYAPPLRVRLLKVIDTSWFKIIDGTGAFSSLHGMFNDPDEQIGIVAHCTDRA